MAFPRTLAPKNGTTKECMCECIFAMAAAIRADAAAWDVVHIQRWLQPQASAPGALGPQARRPAAACGLRPPGADS